MTDFLNTLRNLWGVLINISLIDVVDILILAFLIFHLWKLVRETRANQLMKAILLLGIAYLLVSELGMKALTFILGETFSMGLIALCILFQPELRRAMEKVGHTKVGNRFTGFLSPTPDDEVLRWETAIDAITSACEDLSATCTGALIVIEQEVRLGEQIETGTLMNALPSRQLFGNIFYTKTPLHDGAVIMRGGLILAAACFLPKPQKDELINKQLGSRHRAAIGMSENSDAIIIVVSEETGTISIAEDGELTRGYTKESLRKYLTEKLIPEKPVSGIRKKNSVFKLWRSKKK